MICCYLMIMARLQLKLLLLTVTKEMRLQRSNLLITTLLLQLIATLLLLLMEKLHQPLHLIRLIALLMRVQKILRRRLSGIRQQKNLLRPQAMIRMFWMNGQRLLMKISPEQKKLRSKANQMMPVLLTSGLLL